MAEGTIPPNVYIVSQVAGNPAFAATLIVSMSILWFGFADAVDVWQRFDKWSLNSANWMSLPSIAKG